MSLYTELRGLINRGGTFSLAQNRKLRDITKAISDAIDSAALTGGTTDPVDLYGGALQYGTVTWLSGLTFHVSNCGYIIEGNSYTSQQIDITLDTADVTNPRIDVIYVDSDGQVGKLTGTAAADPAKPEVDSSTQLELTFISVAASATEPDNVSAGVIYAEDAGDPGEWDFTETTSAARIDLDSTGDSYAGTKSIELISAISGDYIQGVAGAANAIVVAAIDSIESHIKVLSWGKKDYLEYSLFDGITRITSWVRVAHANYGFDRTNIGNWQTITIPKADFNMELGTADTLRIRVGGQGASISAYIDQIRSQEGGGTVIINNSYGLTEEELINTVRTFNVQQVMDSTTLTDGATITWDLDASPIATVTLDGNRTLNFINARAGGTYILKIIQDATTGSRTVTWDADVEWPGGTAPTLSTAVNAEDVFSFVAFDDTTLQGTTAGLEFS